MEDNNLLFIKYNETKSKEDYEKLFLNNINLIRHVILKTVNLPLRTEKQILDEFIDVGYIGLTKAIKSYDINRMNETNFTSYAYKCIEYEIYRELKKRPPQLETNISLSSKINEEDDTDLEYYFGEDDKNFENIHSEEYKKYSRKLLEIIINSIQNQKYIEIIKMYYGLDGYKKMTYREIAKVYGCSYENIRIIVNKCIKSMREKSIDINENNAGINGFDISLENAKKQMEDSKIRKTTYMNELLASYSMDEIIDYIEKLNDSKKTAIKMYLGIGGYDKTTQKEIGKYLNIKNSYVSRYIKNCFKTLKKKMDKADKNEEVNNEIKHSHSVNKYELFINKYGKENVEKAVLELSNSDQYFLYQLMNCNFSIKEIIRTYNIQESNAYYRNGVVFKRLEKVIKYGKPTLYENKIYKKIKDNYDEETIKNAILKLDSKDQEFMKVFYDLNCSTTKVADYYKVSTPAICIKEKRIFKNIENIIKGVNDDNYQSLYDRLVNIYGKEKLDEAITKLSPENQNFIKIFDSFKGSCSEIAKYYGIENNTVYTRKSNILKRIKIIVETGNRTSKKKNLYNDFKNKYDEETIKEAITKLDSKDQEFMKVFYDLNCLTKKVADYYGVSASATCLKEKRIFKNIENIINGVVKDEYKSLYSELVDIYGKEELDKAIAKLTIKDQEFIKIFDNFKGSCSEVAKYYETNKNYVYKRKNDILRIIKTVIETGKYNNDKRNLYNNLKDKYDEETIKEAITKLDSKDQEFMKVFYDSNCSSKEVAKYYGISASAIYVKEKRIFKNIENIIDGVKENNYQSLYNELVNTYGKEALDEAILKLNAMDQKFIEIYDSFYGSCNEVAKYYGMEKNSVYTKKSNILKRIKIIVETGKRATNKKNLYNDLKDKYGEEAIKAVITKLKNKEQKFMNIFYENDCMISKVAKIYGRTLSYMSQLERKIFDKIENILNGNVKKYKLMENYDEETIKEVITKLNKKDQEFAKVIESFNGSYEKVADYYNVSLETIYSKKAALTKKIKKAIEIDEYKPKKENLYTKLSNKFNEEEIKKAILKLNDKDKEFMRVFYENNGSPTKISKYYDVSGPVVIKKEKRIFANIENIINGEKVDPFDKLVLEFGKDKVINSINALTSRSKSVMEDKYGLNGNSALSLNELKEKYNSNNDAIYAVIYYSLKRMKEYLTKSENTYAYLKKVLNSDSKENVKKALNDLSDDEKLIIWLYLGLDKEHKLDINKISKILNKTDDEVIEKINLIADKISKILKKNINKK